MRGWSELWSSRGRRGDFAAPLTDLVPLYRTNSDEIVTQYDMGGLEKIGLLKMDFLGLTTLTLFTDAFN